MPGAQRPPSSRRHVLSGLALVLGLGACGPRVAPVPLDGDLDPPAPPPPAVTAAEDAPAGGTLTEEALPEIAAPGPDAAPEPAAAAPPGGSPAPGGELAPATPSPLASIGPGAAPNVAAATRLADAARERLAIGDDAAALEQLERAIAVDPNNAYAYFFLAQLHFRTRNYDQAIAFADRAATLSAGASPEWTSRAWCLQGNAFEAAGRFADARQAYLRAVRAAPNNIAAAVGLARIGGGSLP
jgi:hypothetical protein